MESIMGKTRVKGIVMGIICMAMIIVGMTFTEKVSAKTEISGSYATVTTQKEFDKVVKDESITTIDVTGEWTEFVAPKGDYSYLMVRFNFDNSDVKITVPKGAHYHYFTLSGKNGGKYTLVNRGKIDEAYIYQDCTYTIYQNATLDKLGLGSNCKSIKIKGSSKSETLVEVLKSSKTVKMDTTKKVEVDAYNSVNLIIRSGAQGSTIKAKTLDIKFTINNKASKAVYMYDFFGEKSTVKAKTKKEFKILSSDVSADMVHKDKWDKYSSTLIYDSLNANQKKFYDTIKARLDQYLFTTVDVTGSTISHGDGIQYDIEFYKPDYLTDQEMLEVINIFDSSKYFYVDYACVAFGGYGDVCTEPMLSLSVDAALANGKYRLALAAKAEADMEAWVADINANAETDYEKLKCLYDKLCDAATPGRPEYYEVSRTLFSGATELSNEGYARTFCAMANALGFDSYVICTQRMYGVRVLYNGEWKFVCAFYDDQTYEMIDERYYSYFLIDLYEEPLYVTVDENGDSVYVSYEYMFDLK